MSIFSKKEKSIPLIPVPLTPQQESDQWLADLTQKLREWGLPNQTAPSADDRNAAAIAQSVRQYIEFHPRKK